MTGALVRRPVAVTMLLAAGCLLGAVSYGRLPVELVPFAELPMLVVQVQGARDSEPEQVESRAVVPLEGAIAGLPGIERIESYVESRGARILVYYSSRVDPGHAYLRLEQRVTAAAAGLDEEIGVRVLKVDTEQLSTQFMSLEARGEGGLDRIRHVVDRKVVEELRHVDGVANVSVFGGRRRSIEVRLDEEVLVGHGLTAAQVGARVARGSRPRRHLGEVGGGGGRFFVSLVSDYTSMADLEETVLREGLRLGHVASVVDGGAERQTIARVNGLEAVSVSLMRDPEANLLEVSAAATEVVERLNRQLEPEGVELVVGSDAAEPVRDNIGDIQSLALLGGGLAVAVLWIFLRNLVLVAVVALAIPVSVLISLNLFHALDLTLNSLSLVGMAVAVGMLIDNSIVVLESIYRRLARGETPDEAVTGGVADVRRAVVAATLTTVCVFLPFVFAEGYLIRLLGREVGVAIISTLLVSLAVALLLIPVVTWRLAVRRSGAGLASTPSPSASGRCRSTRCCSSRACASRRAPSSPPWPASSSPWPSAWPSASTARARWSWTASTCTRGCRAGPPSSWPTSWPWPWTRAWPRWRSWRSAASPCGPISCTSTWVCARTSGRSPAAAWARCGRRCTRS